MRWYERIVTALTSVTNDVSHGERLKSNRFIVWQEDSGNYLRCNNSAVEKSIEGTIDLFSKTELDSWSDLIEDALDANGVSFYLNSVQFEPDTRFWHWEWVFNSADNGT